MSNASQTAPGNTAVAQCCEIMERTYLDILAPCNKRAGESEDECRSRAVDAAARAYAEAMPPLTGPDNIRDFIACVAKGMLLEVFTGSQPTCLLYAAQVASTAAQRRASRAQPA